MRLTQTGSLLFCFVLLSFLPTVSIAQDRWNQTATNGSGLGLGDPTTVTWSFVPDGTTIVPAISGESSDPSSLLGFLDTHLGAGDGGTDLSSRPWFQHFESFFDRWDSISGLSFVYEPNDDGQSISSSVFPRGQLGVRGDVRIGGHSIDGQAGQNTLAYNWSPDNGEMVIDTDNITFFSNSANNYRGLRNVLAHEFGHGMGIPHHESNNSAQLLEPFINLSFDGPQIDDIHQAQRRYGDALEENGGNDTVGTAANFGLLNGNAIVIGADANQGSSVQEVTPDQFDFMSIDDDSDVDIFAFSIDRTADVDVLLEMVGPTYNRGPQGGSQSVYDLSQRSDLDLVLLDSDGTTVLGQSNTTGLGIDELLSMELDAGTYYIQITGRDNDAQFYQLSISSSIPEPATATILSLLMLAGVSRVRVRKNRRQA